MKITAFNASPWGQEGHTHIIMLEFLLGAVQQGAKARTIQLVTKKIQPCSNCGICFYKTPGRCVLKDDMAQLIEIFMASDIVIFATPLYIDNVSALMKTFIDRLLPILEPHYEKDPSGRYRRCRRFKKYPKFVIIATCAMPEQTNFEPLRLFFQRMARTMYTEIVGEIYLGAAGILRLSREDLRFRPAVSKYKKLLQAAGRELVLAGNIGPQTEAKLAEPIIDADCYAQYANKIWDLMLTKHSALSP